MQKFNRGEAAEKIIAGVLEGPDEERIKFMLLSGFEGLFKLSDKEFLEYFIYYGLGLKDNKDVPPFLFEMWDSREMEIEAVGDSGGPGIRIGSVTYDWEYF